MRPGSRDGEGRDHPHWRWRDRILDDAEPIAGEVVLDVGCGEGLVAFGALERNAREAVFSDISNDLLDFCRAAAAGLATTWVRSPTSLASFARCMSGSSRRRPIRCSPSTSET
jgi:methylase of polypeptide subunit release factors